MISLRLDWTVYIYARHQPYILQLPYIYYIISAFYPAWHSILGKCELVCL